MNGIMRQMPTQTQLKLHSITLKAILQHMEAGIGL